MEQFSNHGNRIKTLRFPGTTGSQPGTVNFIIYSFGEDELNTEPLAVTQVSLKIRHKHREVLSTLRLMLKYHKKEKDFTADFF